MPNCRYSLPQAILMTTKNRNTGMEVPVARPSTPSVMFTALTVPTMTKAANMKYSHSGMWMVVWKKGT